MSAPVDEVTIRCSRIAALSSVTAPNFSSLLVMWLVGNEMNIFTLMFVGQYAYSVLSNIFSMNAYFTPHVPDANATDLTADDKARIHSAISTTKQKFMLWSLVSLAILAWKFNAMGLLPTSPWDWLTLTPPPPAILVLGAHSS